MKIGFDNEKYLKMQSEHIMERIKKEFGLMNYRDYHAEATEKQNEWREKYSI